MAIVADGNVSTRQPFDLLAAGAYYVEKIFVSLGYRFLLVEDINVSFNTVPKAEAVRLYSAVTA